MKKKYLYAWCRALHIYLSTALFTLLIFFCISGFLLNHLALLSKDKSTGKQIGRIPQQLITEFSEDSPSQAKILFSLQIYFSEKYQLKQLSQVEWDEEMQELLLDYPVPAGFALVIINLENYQFVIEHQQNDIVNIINDLHKGRHAGQVWSLLIDISAILITLFSLTGLIILFQNKKKRFLGAWLTVLGTGTPCLIYWFFVPRLAGI